MFANVGWGEMLVLVIAGLVILGPERLPGASAALAATRNGTPRRPSAKSWARPLPP